MTYDCHAASREELIRLWDKNIAAHPQDSRWVGWKAQFLHDNQTGAARTFVVTCGGEPVGEGTLLMDPCCRAIGGRLQLADSRACVNINALRIEKAHEGRGHISALVRLMERWAAAQGFVQITIGVEACETRNLAIYLHWGYTQLVHWEAEEDGLVLYYAKNISQGATL